MIAWVEARGAVGWPTGPCCLWYNGKIVFLPIRLQDLVEFSKTHDVQLLTHADPKGRPPAHVHDTVQAVRAYCTDTYLASHKYMGVVPLSCFEDSGWFLICFEFPLCIAHWLEYVVSAVRIGWKKDSSAHWLEKGVSPVRVDWNRSARLPAYGYAVRQKYATRTFEIRVD